MPDSESDLVSRLEHLLRASPEVMHVLEAARTAGLPDWRLFAGAVYQTVWNGLTGRSPSYGVRDYDIGYFDADLSDEAEAGHRADVLGRIPKALRDQVEIVNQARVHLWFETEFGRPYPALASTDEGLRRSLSTVHAVGVRLEPDGNLTIAAPYGLRDIFDMVLRANPDLQAFDAHDAKAQDALTRWPELVMAGRSGET